MTVLGSNANIIDKNKKKGELIDFVCNGKCILGIVLRPNGEINAVPISDLKLIVNAKD